MADLGVVGFACNWERNPAQTWSHIPWNLLGALDTELPGQVRDLGPRLPLPVRLGARAVATRRVDGRWVSLWKHSAVTDLAVGHQLRRALRRSPCDVVVQVHDLAVLDEPFLVFQDLSYQALIDLWDAGSTLQVAGLSFDLVRRRRDRQQQIYERAAGVVAMSHWFANQLVERSGIEPGRVHVAYPGISVSPIPPVPPRPASERTRLLIVGRDFDRKGGPEVVEAVRALRRGGGGRPVELTIVGPAALPSGISAAEPGINFVGPLGHDALARCFSSHDLFVMPSRFEAFGIAFVEALSQGLPCVARDAFAMPEVIRPGENGALVSSNDPQELAETISATLDDDHIHQTAFSEAALIAERFSWSACAQAVVGAATSALQQPRRPG